MEHLTETRIKTAEFFFKHGEFLKRLLIFSIFFIDLVIVSGLALRWVAYNRGILQQLNLEKSLAVNYIPFKQIRQNQKPVDLVIKKIDVTYEQGRTVDLVAEIENPNSKWLVREVEFIFSFNGQKLPSQKTFILPLQKKYVMKFNVLAGNSTRVRLDIGKIDWHRIRDKKALETFKQIKVRNISFKNLQTGGFQVQGDLENTSTFSFWATGLQAVVLRLQSFDGASKAQGKSLQQAEVIAANLTTLEELMSNSVRHFKFTWPESIYGADEVKIIPEINVFDKNIYMPFGVDSLRGDPSGIE